MTSKVGSSIIWVDLEVLVAVYLYQYVYMNVLRDPTWGVHPHL